MPATISTLTVKDASGTSRQIRAVDLSGLGSGPFVPLNALTDAAGVPIDAANPMPISDAESAPSGHVKPLTYAMTDDATDLADNVRALRIYNGTDNPVTLSCLTDADTVNAFPITVPAKQASYELIAVSRIKRTGSTNLITAGAITTGIEVLLLL